MSVEKILDRLGGVIGEHPRWKARCPAHDDKSPSLGIKVLDDGRILMNCLAGCGKADVLEAIGITLSDLYPKGLGQYIPGKRSPRRFTKTEYIYGDEGARKLREENERLRKLLNAKS